MIIEAEKVMLDAATAKADKRELLSRLKVLLMHLLKWQFQADKRSKSWKMTINVYQKMFLQATAHILWNKH